MKLISRVKKWRYRFFKDDVILNKFVSGAFWALFGSVVVKGLSLLGSAIIARFLGSVSFGELSIIKTTLTVFSLFATFGLGLTVTKFVAENRKDRPLEIGSVISAANTITLVTGMALGFSLIFLAQFISANILHSEILKIPLMISGVYLLFNAQNVYQTGVLAGLNAFKKLAKVNFIVGIVSLPIQVISTYLGGLNGALIGMTLGLTLNWYLYRRLIQKELKQLNVSVRDGHSFDHLLRLLKFSYPLALSEAIYSFSNWFLIYLLLVKTNYGEVGLFTSADQWAQMILFLPVAISSVLLSYLSNSVGNVSVYNNILKKNILFNIALALVLATILSIGSKTIFYFYGESFEEAYKILSIMAFAMVPMAVINVFEQALISRSKSKLIAIFKFVRQSLVLIFAFFFLSIKPEATSLAMSFLIGYSSATVLMAMYIWKVFFRKTQIPVSS